MSESRFVFITSQTVPSAELSTVTDWCRLSAQDASRLRNEGLFAPIRNADGDMVPDRYNLCDCVGRYIGRLRQKLKDVIEANPKTAYERVNLERVKAATETAVMRNMILRGILVRAEDIHSVMSEIMVSLRSRLLGFGSRLGPLLAGKEDAGEIARIINEQLEDLLNEYDKPIDPEVVQSRNHKLYSDIRYTLDSNRGRPSRRADAI